MVRPRGVAVSRENNSLPCPTAILPGTEKIEPFRDVSNRDFRVPLGGTTGLCHTATARIDEVAEWYAVHRDAAELPIVPALRKRFGLTPLEAVQAIRDANARLRA